MNSRSPSLQFSFSSLLHHLPFPSLPSTSLLLDPARVFGEHYKIGSQAQYGAFWLFEVKKQITGYEF